MRPKFSVNQIVTLTNFHPPLLSGSQVAVLDVKDTGRQIMYEIKPVEYPGEAKWVRESELAAPLEVVE
jgi:hypothetical protein